MPRQAPVLTVMLFTVIPLMMIMTILFAGAVAVGRAAGGDVIIYRTSWFRHAPDARTLTIHDVATGLRLPMLDRMTSATIAPDRTWAVYSLAPDSNGETRCGLLDLQAMRTLTERKAPTCQIWMSPTGQRALIATNQSNRFTFEFFQADGSSYHRVTMGQPISLRPPSTTGSIAWSPDDQHVIFAYQNGGNGTWAVHHIDTQGSGARAVGGSMRLTVNALWGQGWQPNSAAFLFSALTFADERWGWWRFRPGRGMDRIDDFTDGLRSELWHTSGEHFLLIDKDDDGEQVFLVDAETLQRTPLTERVVQVEADWLMDTDWVRVNLYDEDNALHLVHMASDEVLRLVEDSPTRPPSNFVAGRLGYAMPDHRFGVIDLVDGEQVFYEDAPTPFPMFRLPSSRDGRFATAAMINEAGTFDLLVLDLVSGERHQHVGLFTGRHSNVTFGLGDDTWLHEGQLLLLDTVDQPTPQFTPFALDSNAVHQPDTHTDGRRVVFSSLAADGSGDIYLLDTETLHLRRLTHTPANEFQVMWLPDNNR